MHLTVQYSTSVIIQLIIIEQLEIQHLEITVHHGLIVAQASAVQSSLVHFYAEPSASFRSQLANNTITITSAGK